MKKLGFGLMRLPLINKDDISTIDLETTKKMVDVFMEYGFSYYDTAYTYHNGNSETAFREAVVKRYPRESFTITDKLPCWAIHSAADLERIFNEQLNRCGVEYFDYYWLHALNKNYYATMQNVDGFGFISQKKAEGKIRHIGFSFHDEPALLEQILSEHPETEYVQLQINYLDWNDPTVRANECYEICRRHKKEIIVMEPVKGGALAKVPQQVEEMFRNSDSQASPASWAVRYAASLPGIIMVLSGMSNLEQINDNTSYMEDFQPLTDEEKMIVGSATAIIKDAVAIPCTACHYCTEDCPMQIAIPEYLAIYNTLHQFRQEHQWLNTKAYYDKLNSSHGKASDCIQCGQCEARCPQHIAIIDNLQKVAESLE